QLVNIEPREKQRCATCSARTALNPLMKEVSGSGAPVGPDRHGAKPAPFCSNGVLDKFVECGGRQPAGLLEISLEMEPCSPICREHLRSTFGKQQLDDGVKRSGLPIALNRIAQ